MENEQVRIVQGRINSVLNDPSVRNFAKRTLTEALDRDPVDALVDLDLVVELVRARLEAIVN